MSTREKRWKLWIVALVVLTAFALLAAPTGLTQEKKPKPGGATPAKSPTATPGGGAPKGPETMGTPTPHLVIKYFRKAVDPGRMALPGIGAAPESADIELGDRITLCWNIETGGGEGSPTTELSGVGPVSPGTRSAAPDGTVNYRGEITLSPTTTTRYTLSARRGALGTTRTYTVQVLRPAFDVLQPEINQSTLEAAFYVQNTGEAAFRAAPLNVEYEVLGFGGRSTFPITSGTFTTAPTAINRGQRVRLGAVTLEAHRARLLYYDSAYLFVRVRAAGTQPVESRREQFTHPWTNHTFTLNQETLNLVCMGSCCEVRLNNYLASGGHHPYARNDSFISMDIMDTHFDQRFNLRAETYTVRVTGRVSGHDYVNERVMFFINEITALSRGRTDLFYIRDGKFGMHLDFPNSGHSEIKIGTVNDAGFQDGEIGDINIGSFTVDALLTPSINSADERISYSSIEVIVPEISASLVGRYDGLNPFIRDYLRDYVTGEVRRQLSSILEGGGIKRAIEQGVTGAMRSLPGGGTFSHLVRIEGSGNTITVTYR
jgi:hypothetical protein